MSFGFPFRRSPATEGQRTWSQSGEDAIIAFLLEHELHVASPTYLDIGAHHPTYLSNTYLFYTRGSRGVLVEPDPVLFEDILRVRKRDTCLNIGIGLGEARDAELFVMSAPTLNTFVREEAERIAAMGFHRIEKVVKVPLVPVNQILAEHFQRGPEILSLDVEGLDLQILQSLDYERFRPTVVCVETLTYADDKTAHKLPEIPAFLATKGYEIYADTRINTILVDGEAWKRRK
jgi:FkbM family methyltransferase